MGKQAEMPKLGWIQIPLHAFVARTLANAMQLRANNSYEQWISYSLCNTTPPAPSTSFIVQWNNEYSKWNITVRSLDCCVRVCASTELSFHLKNHTSQKFLQMHAHKCVTWYQFKTERSAFVVLHIVLVMNRSFSTRTRPSRDNAD